jgi:polyferredoxin
MNNAPACPAAKPADRGIKTRRRLVQAAFVVLTVVGVFVVQGNAERWCPMGGVETLYTYLTEGNLICSLGISNLYILAALLLVTLLLRRAFCGYVCPLGAIGEGLNWLGRRLHLPRFRISGTPDRGLALLKYVGLAAILYFTWRSAELVFRGYDPCYALLSRHGEDITFWAYVISGGLIVLSLLVMLPFCRWLCPFAAVLHPFSRFGITRVRRNTEGCVDCGACKRACPMAIPVDKVDEVTAARCISCLNCVAACPPKTGGALAWGPPAKWSRPWSQTALLAVLLGGIGIAVAASYAVPVPSFVKVRGTAPATTASVDLEVNDLTCRGRASLLVYYLERDDELAIPGYLRIEAWPGPDPAALRVTYDPAQATEEDIKFALTEAYYDNVAHVWRPSPFTIKGYDPLALPPLPE